METALLLLVALLGVASLVALGSVLALHSRLNQVIAALPDAQAIRSLADRLTQVDVSNRASFENLARTIGGLEQATKQMMDIGKTITNLEDLLQPPKLRGGMGETLLSALLSQILPGACEFEHCFASGERVDAVIRLGDRLVPVDAKFPLEAFRRLATARQGAEATRERAAFLRTIKAHIRQIAAKYILPDEGTYDFALMYIPAENVYYETILKEEGDEGLFAFALAKRVIPVSPNSFYAYLQVIIHGLKGLQIEQRAREIMGYLDRLRGDERRFRDEFSTLGTHIENARKKYEDAQLRLARFEEKLASPGEAAGPGELPPAGGEAGGPG